MDYTDLYFNSQWRNALSAERFDVINRANEELIASVASTESISKIDVQEHLPQSRKTQYMSAEW